jgi:hypothetical protein
MYMKQKNIIHWLSVIVIGIVLGLGLQFVRAWTEPTVDPPGGNLGAPINTSAMVQTKAGGFTAIGGLTSGSDIKLNGQLLDESDRPAFFVNVSHDDCGWYFPYMGCPAGYMAVGWWHTGRGACDSQVDGDGYYNGLTDSGWMCLCAATSG